MHVHYFGYLINILKEKQTVGDIVLFRVSNVLISWVVILAGQHIGMSRIRIFS